jgi:uncharacterized secreted protein with C-terminal beta-propeller domain
VLVRVGSMNEEKEKKLKKLTEILWENFSEKELKEIKDFLERLAALLIEAYIDGDLS